MARRVGSPGEADLKEIKTVIYKVPHRGESIGVISPAAPVRRLFVTCRANGYWAVTCDAPGFSALAGLAMVAALHKRSIVHVPATDSRPSWSEGFEAHDLVLVHHSLQLPPSNWKAMRRYLKDGKPKSLEVPPPDKTQEVDWETRLKGKDLFDLADHSRTVFLTGSEVLLRYLAGCFASLATCTETGDHSHLFALARHERMRGSMDDLTMMYCAPVDWT